MKNFNELVQLSLPMLSEIPKPRYLEDILIETLSDYGAAIRLCIESRVRRFSEAEIARCLGFKPPHLSKVKQGAGYLTTDQTLVLQHLCSNWAMRQYADRRRKQLAELIESPLEKINRLEIELSALRQRRAA